MDFESWYLANKKRQLLALKEVSTKTGYGLELIVIYIMGINVIILEASFLPNWKSSLQIQNIFKMEHISILKSEESIYEVSDV